MGILDWLFGKQNVVGKSNSDATAGVYGGNDADGNGVVGETNGKGAGVFGQSATGNGVTGGAWTFGQVGVWGFYSEAADPPQRGAAFARPVTAGVWGTTANEGEVPRDSGRDHRLRRASGVVGEASLPGAGFGYGVLGLGYKDEGVVGWSQHAAGGKFEGLTGAECTGKKGPGITAKSKESPGGRFESTEHGQICLVPRAVEFGTGDQGVSYPKLPATGQSGEMITVVHQNGECSLWLCVQSFRLTQTGGGIHIPIPAAWAQVRLGSAISGEG
ncbi:hypothetical protein [Streptomyces sp. NBC_01244]|uniref:hypothetical protein n=1 Tax=Streptomyces sp. NBC_01244 TaxID=2903797 RepID=UPI002E122D50|nr:hypothetical protein OG247_37750 [Streptomyces sp. NBC_01244]